MARPAFERQYFIRRLMAVGLRYESVQSLGRGQDVKVERYIAAFIIPLSGRKAA
jgi:hypothetical protein